MTIRPSLSPIILLAAVSVAGFSCGDSKSAGGSGTNNADAPVNVRVEVLKPVDFSESIQLTGIVKALEDVTVTPEEGGTLKEWTCDKGRFVERGTIIALLDDGVVKPAYDAAVAQYNTAELVYDNQKSVYAVQAISETQLKTSGYTRDAAKAQADLMKARFERTRVRAPISGILDDRFADVGEMAPPGVPLARIVNLAAVKVVINIPERYAGQLQKGSPVDFAVISYPGQTFRGKITFIGSAISPDNRTFPVEAELQNPGGKLKPEMIARASIRQASRKQALAVREDIVQQVDRDRQIVYVDEQGIARERRVQLGGRSGNSVEVVAGLKAGDRIITAGFQNVVDGQAIAVAPAK